MNFDNFDGIFAALFGFAPDDLLTLACAADGTWSAEIDYASTEGAPTPIDAIGIVLMQFVRDEELVFHNADEVNGVLLHAVGVFMEKASPSITGSLQYEVYRNDHGFIGNEWEAVLSANEGDLDVYSIEKGSSPGEALRNLIRAIHTWPDAKARRQRRDTPPAVAQFGPPPIEEKQPPAAELVAIEEAA